MQREKQKKEGETRELEGISGFEVEEVVFRDAEYSSEKGEILSSMMELKEEMDNFEQSSRNLPDAFTLGLFSLVELNKTYVTPLTAFTILTHIR